MIWQREPAPDGGGKANIMARIAFTMKLHPGQTEEYRRRHDAIWPELSDLLHRTSIR
ncbi:MAG TPA: L-rhamnose mutarotase, partial [Puia sp.]|nr:L-rhamnose mutarotase [Puia sp.]